MINKHLAEQYGAKKHVTGISTQVKKQYFSFEWEVGSYSINNVPGVPGYVKNGEKAVVKLQQLQKYLEIFADFAGVSIDEVNFGIGYNHSYYDSVELFYEFSIHRDETDEEYEARKPLIEHAQKKAAEAAEKAKITKEEKDKKELARLIKKYGKITALALVEEAR